MLPGSVRAPDVSIAVDADENVGQSFPPGSTFPEAHDSPGDESKPTCTGCRRRGEKCQWRVLGSFREANIKVLEPGHPSMNQSVGRNNRQSKFKILNVDPPSARKERARKEQTLPERAPSAQPQQESQQEASAPSPLPVGYPDQTQAQLPQSEFHPCDDQGLSPSLSSNASFYPAAEVRNHERDGGCNEEATTEVPNHIPHTASPNHPYMHSSPEFVIDELTALRNFSNNAASFPQAAQEAYQGIASPLFDHSVFSDPVNDVFLPGSAYEALHTTLRNRQLWTARPDIPSRCSSPASVSESGAVTPNGLHPSEVNNYSRPSRPFELSPTRENVLWQNYLNEICLWPYRPARSSENKIRSPSQKAFPCTRRQSISSSRS
ncbi:unnamed protein product [Aspergillus oryzae RIB40]|uniref:DNA, SC003 n=1 Tax=Aspergillus oryzae (strain ATCC 42149 / RIB 40) TaxID=510516 RepID=Q2UJB4_ASPOR|nr:unnamed protein product [Aspergillus oryzae RIB40]BAE58351.1 unnamed protein product [Aspergillus oryzae RIB40]